MLSICVRRSGKTALSPFVAWPKESVGIDDNSKLLGHHEYIIGEGASVEYIRLFYVDALTDPP